MKIKKILISFGFILIFLHNAFAMDFIIGAKGGYYEWNPWIKYINADILENIDTGSGVLYGPVLSFIFNPEMSISFAALTGKQTVHWYSENYNYTHYLGPVLSTSSAGSADYKRTDIDTAFSYRIMRDFKLFIGYKYQSIDIIIKSMIRRSETGADTIEYIELGEYEIETPAHGPAVGIGYTMTFDKGYFIAVNLSGLYMYGKFDVKKLDTIQYDATTGNLNDPIPIYKGEPDSLDIRQHGFNLEPTIGKIIDNNKIILTLGVRYQLLRTKFIETDPNLKPKEEWMNDYLYGIFVSVLFVF